MFIYKATSVSCQPLFGSNGFAGMLKECTNKPQLIKPEYGKYIPPALSRRMSEILKMSVACAVELTSHDVTLKPEAILVGTGLGCLEDTEKFLQAYLSVSGDLIPPTSFIQSTHNTIAGQISLILKNHGYNMTHTRNTVSFELALMDAELCLMEGRKFVLAGGADERINLLEMAASYFCFGQKQLGSGAGFFLLGAAKGKETPAIKTTVFEVNENLEGEIKTFLSEQIPSLILYAGNPNFPTQFSSIPTLNYESYFGTFFTGPAVALHWASDILLNRGKGEMQHTLFKGSGPVLIWNNLNPATLGLTQVSL